MLPPAAELGAGSVLEERKMLAFRLEMETALQWSDAYLVIHDDSPRA